MAQRVIDGANVVGCGDAVHRHLAGFRVYFHVSHLGGVGGYGRFFRIGGGFPFNGRAKGGD